MKKHQTAVKESSYPWYRVWCYVCGWDDYTMSWRHAKKLGKAHEEENS